MLCGSQTCEIPSPHPAGNNGWAEVANQLVNAPQCWVENMDKPFGFQDLSSSRDIRLSLRTSSPPVPQAAHTLPFRPFIHCASANTNPLDACTQPTYEPLVHRDRDRNSIYDRGAKLTSSPAIETPVLGSKMAPVCGSKDALLQNGVRRHAMCESIILLRRRHSGKLGKLTVLCEYESVKLEIWGWGCRGKENTSAMVQEPAGYR